MAIGMSLPHMHADPTCAALFIKAWADSHRRSYIVHPPFFHPPGLQPRPTPNITPSTSSFLATKSQQVLPPPGTHMSSATFHFSESSIKSCISGSSRDATPFDALAAVFWLAVAQPGQSRITVCTEFRKSMHAPLPHGFYGNALHFSRIEAELTSDSGPLIYAVKSHLAGLEEEEYWSEIDWFSENKGGGAFQMYGPELTVVKMDHMMAYGPEFEKGCVPVHVACRLGGVEGEGVVVVLPAAEEGLARNVTVTVPETVMERVCKDEGILKLAPKIMFKG